MYLDNTGASALHILNDLSIGFNPNGLFGGGSTVISSNSTLIVDGLLGGQLSDDGTLVIAGGSLITTNCGIQVGVSLIEGCCKPSGILIVSNAVLQAQGITIGAYYDSGGYVGVIGGTMTLSSSLLVGNEEYGAGGSMLVANGAWLVVTNGDTDIGGIYQSAGTMTVTGSTFFANNLSLGGTRSEGTLAINNSTIILNGGIQIGNGEEGTGSVSLDGGMLVVTNGSISIAVGDTSGLSTLTIYNGLFLARDVSIGAYEAGGGLTIYGGTSILSSTLQIGQVNSSAYVSLHGGALFVTNALITIDDSGSCGVSDGRLAAQAIVLGVYETGWLSVDDGSVTVSDGITLGDCVEGLFSGKGYASVNGGQVSITNATGLPGFIDVRQGQLTLSGGTLQSRPIRS